MPAKVKVGLIGVGNISQQYIKGIRSFEILELAACCDIDVERAKAVAAQHDIPKAYSVEEMLADPDIQIVVNLTIPKAHAEVSLKAIAAGKHLYSEKPLAINLEDGKRIIDAAAAKGVLVGCAPDTFLGGGLQTSRKLIDDGVIGQPVAAVAFMAGRGPEGWHPNPDFFYQAGGGPMLDMGPYYITALVNLLGPVKRVSGVARASFPERIAGSEQNKGRHIPVEVPTHYTGVLEFVSGAVATIITSFDVWWGHHLPLIEVFGAEGNLSVPDPNTFGGMVRVSAHGGEWQERHLTHSDAVGRGIGVADMAYALTYKRPHRASGALAYHVLEIMTSFERATSTGTYITIESRPTQPTPLPLHLPTGQLDH